MTDQAKILTEREKREAFAARCTEVLTGLSVALHERAMDLYDRMASSERKSLGEDLNNHRLAKTVICALPADRVVYNAIATESIRLQITRCRRIYNSRIG